MNPSLISISREMDTIEQHYCGVLNVECCYCKALHFHAEKPSDGKFNNCCHKGKVKIEMPIFPNYLKNIMSISTNVDYKNFQQNIRSYNNAISFASMGAKLATNIPGNGPYCFKIQGQTYHRVSHLNPPEGIHRKYAQLYVLDTTQAVEERMNLRENEQCLEKVMRELDIIMRNNPFVKNFKRLEEMEREQTDFALFNNLEIPRVNMVLRRDRHSDNRRYNLPKANEVAMIFANDDGEPPFQRDIRIYPRDNKTPFVNINILSPNLDPMTYPIFYPNGEAGWQPNLLLNSYENAKIGKRNNVSMLQFKIAQLAIRQNTFNPILHGGKLTQQWIIDSHLQVEANNINFIRNQQSKLRSEEYLGLMDYVNKGAKNAGVQAGRAIILPSSFQGSPRNMKERYNDAISIVTKFGKPDVFCTFTCNPNWKEICENLFQGQTVSDRPDLIARVFHIKLQALIRDITSGALFGKVLAYVYTIEFQKRGLPHAHILLILHENNKFKDASQVDNYIKAEIPDSTVNPRLFDIVTKNMIHGPCGILNYKSPCMEDGKCTKEFPKQFQSKTKVNVNGYPLYQRREGPAVIIRNKPVDNRFVVPYNPTLLLKYNAHINVEACTSIKSIKYIYKYIYKGYDCANIAIKTSHLNQPNEFVYDEVANYIDCRYISAPEAMWRLLEFEMHKRSHAIVRLSVHLDNRQIVPFLPGEENKALIRAAAKDTSLTAWYKLNATDENAMQHLYSDIPYFYVLINGGWKVRQRGRDKIISRIYTVSPKDTERFCLRLLMLHIPGAPNSEYLRTVGGILYPTFKEAARERQLLAEDIEWERCLLEASSFQMPKLLRQTFAYICVFCNPNNPHNLWIKFKEYFCDDLRSTLGISVAENIALLEIEEILVMHGLNCVSLNLPVPKTVTTLQTYNFNVTVEGTEAASRIQSLNPMQHEAFNKVSQALDNHDFNQRCFYLDGPGGSGKTYLYNTLMCYVRGLGEMVLPFSTTGISAILLKGGQTLHSGFKLPIPINETSVSAIRGTSSEAKKFRATKLIIIDEATMMTCHALRCIDRFLREVMANDLPFGNKIILLGGDFRQTLPVVVRGTRTDIVESCVKSSNLWGHFVQLRLTDNMRSNGENKFNQWLLNIGEGKIATIPGLEENMVEIPPEMVCKESIISAVYGHKIDLESVRKLHHKVILTIKNKEALVLNNAILKLLPGDSKSYKSVDSVVQDEPDDNTNYPTEFLNSQTPSGMPPHKLTFKIGAIAMLIRNINPKKGLCNGTRLIIRGLHDHFIDTEVLTGTHKGDRVFIPRIDLAPSETNLPFKLKRRQFPLILAFAITINKSQGQTFDSVGVYLDVPVFSHGLLYVALSRCKDPSKIKVLVNTTAKQGELLNDKRIFTKNVIYPEIL